MSIELVMPSNHLILCCPLLLLSSIYPSIRVFSNESASHPVAKVSELQLQHQFSPWIFRVDFLLDWLVWRSNILVVQGTLKSFLQHHSSKASILQCSAVFMIQLSHPYMTTGNTIALITQTFVSKVMSLLFNKLPWFVIAFLPRRKHLLISWLQPLSAMILESKKIKSVTISSFSPSVYHEVIGPDAMILVFSSVCLFFSSSRCLVTFLAFFHYFPKILDLLYSSLFCILFLEGCLSPLHLVIFLGFYFILINFAVFVLAAVGLGVFLLLSALWWWRLRGLCKLPSGKNLQWEKLGLALVGRVLLSKALIRLSTDGWVSLPPW